MPDLIIIKLVPTQPAEGSSFRHILEDLTVTAYDRTIDNSIDGIQIGSATGLVDPNEKIEIIPGNIPTLKKSIIQTVKPKLVFVQIANAWIPDGPPVAWSVATAVIVAIPPPNHPEYRVPNAFDLRIKVDRQGIELIDPTIEYNINVVSVNPPQQLSTDQNDYIAMPSSAYFSLPVEVFDDPSRAVITNGPDGGPPDFDSLCKAVNTVLSSDHQLLLEDRLTPLTAPQCALIAAEITWNRSLDPTPLPPNVDTPLHNGSLENMYTIVDSLDQTTKDNNERSRTQFESALKTYHSTLDGQATRLSTFIAAASAAIACERLSASATAVGITFPVEVPATPSNPSSPPVTTASVILAGSTNAPLDPPFVVPAVYFYVLAAKYPTQISIQQRYNAATMSTEDQLRTQLQAAIDTGLLHATEHRVTKVNGQEDLTPINLDQGARRLAALGSALGQTQVDITSVQDLVTEWLAYPGLSSTMATPGTGFWSTVMTNQAASYVTLVLEAVTNGQTNLVDEIKKQLNPVNVTSLGKMTNTDWLNFFTAHQDLLPNFTGHGTLQQRVDNFVQTLQKFFTVSSVTPSPVNPNPIPVPGFGAASPGDPFSSFLGKYNSITGKALDFSLAPDGQSLEQAMAQIFPESGPARSWLKRVVDTIFALVKMTSFADIGDIRFSVMESLYARGFTTLQDVASLTLDQFQGALLGTVAYPNAEKIRNQCLPVNGPVPVPPESEDQFVPINPDGSLAVCIPPPHLSPLGMIEYLHELLAVQLGETGLGRFVSNRRGHIGQLHATTANLELEIPRIDIVNESLEALAGQLKAPGAINDTNGHTLSGFNLGSPPAQPPSEMYTAIPEHSSVATDQPGVYDTLKNCFTSPDLPYNRGLDISRSYLMSIGTTRFETMRHFRKDITEFAIDAALEPDDFQRCQWRFPVRFELALEYLHISHEEYTSLFSGTASDQDVLKSLGLKTDPLDPTIFTVAGFLKFTGLDYGQFLSLWRCGYVPFSRQDEKDHAFPDCEPCYLGKLAISFGPDNQLFTLHKLFVFVRLWRQIQNVSTGPRISFRELADICNALQLFKDHVVNGEFIRQLAALVLLRDHFKIPLFSHRPDEVNQLLTLWVDQSCDTSEWHWALNCFLEHIEKYAQVRYFCASRDQAFRKDLRDNLYGLSLLAGFSQVDTWHTNPTSTLRFAEVLAKIYASNFSIGEILFLYTVKEHRVGDDPFPLPDPLESIVEPFQLPDNSHHSLWQLRHKLLNVEVTEDDACQWTWDRIEKVLEELGYPGDGTLRIFRERFFPSATSAHGQNVPAPDRRFTVELASASTTSTMWNSTQHGPFHYDADTQCLWSELPVSDEAVLDKLMNTRQFNDVEANAVQSLYFAPRAMLVPFAAVFTDFHSATEKLIHEPCDKERFKFFQQQFAVFYRRCEIIADHLADHVSAVTDRKCKDGRSVAWRVIRSLLADENYPQEASWENDSGNPPETYGWGNWGNAFAAILGLTGTGLLGEFSVPSRDIWRQITGNLTFFGEHQNKANSPITTVIPSLTLGLLPAQLRFASTVNGFARLDTHGQTLGGAQPFEVCWKGALLIEKSGHYTFNVGSPRPDNEEPDFDPVKHNAWLVKVDGGHNSRTLLNHSWNDDEAPDSCSTPLWFHRGIYHIEIHFRQDYPTFTEEVCAHRLHTGFQVKYNGPDTDSKLIALPIQKLFIESKDTTLGRDLGLQTFADAYLEKHYTSTLRDIRRTYQRAFKAILFTHQFNLSTKPIHHNHWHESELNYILQHGDKFLGTSYYRNSESEGSKFDTHHAFLNFNFLPVTDPYCPPPRTADIRVDPTAKRQTALFDSWERLFDYCQLRAFIEKVRKRQVWMLFNEAVIQKSPAPDQLLRYLNVDIHFARQALEYTDDITFFRVSTSDLTDERWAIRVCHAGLWIHGVKKAFYTQTFDETLPWSWVTEDPDTKQDTVSGNQNLMHFFQQSSFGQDEPRSYKEVTLINNGLRERARAALFAYICDQSRLQLPFGNESYVRSPQDLTELLLQDVEVTIHEKATRIEDAVSSIQQFVQRARLGVEPGITPTAEFIHIWDTQYATFKIWEAHKRRELYRENWIHWDELHKAKESEGFRFLESELQRSALTIPKSGGLVWWSEEKVPGTSMLENVQSRDFASFAQPAQSENGLNLLGMTEYDGRPSWLSVVPDSTPISSEPLPLWIKAAVKLGTRFVRVAAASKPPAVNLLNSKAKSSPPTVDEFYFWLGDSSYFDDQDAQQSADLGATPPDPTNDWDPDSPPREGKLSLPELLNWNSRPMVHLYWCQLHLGRYNTPQRSDEGFPIDSAPESTTLQFVRRQADSLFFSVNSTISFRYDMATDLTTAFLPGVPNPDIITNTFPSPMTAYPYFIFYEPGAPLIPPSNYSTAIAIANTLRSHSRFEEALKWYERAFPFFSHDNTWVQSTSQPDVSRHRSIVLEYLECLLQWSDCLLCRQSPEASQHALLLLNTAAKILGQRPKKNFDKESISESTIIEDFVPSATPLNPRLVSLYDRVADNKSLAKLSARTKSKLPSTFPPDFSSLHGRHPYRFLVLLPKALELVAMVRNFGSTLLSTFERADAEYLQCLRATQDQQLLTLSLDTRKNQFRESDWEVQALEKSLAGALARLAWYQTLIQNGLNSGENAFISNTEFALVSRSGATAAMATSQALALVPNAYVGGAGVAGSPLEFEGLPTGSAISQTFHIAGEILNVTGDIANTTANLQLTQAEWDRRLAEWQEAAAQLSGFEIKQIERQKLAADRRRDTALRELNNQQQQIEHSIEIRDLMYQKFTSHDLYLYLQQETAALYRQTYDLALEIARETQRTFRYEILDTRNFIPEGIWDSLKEGLMAGDRLELALHTMERAYMESTPRLHELTKHISLRMHFPAAFLRLKVTGRCEIDLPEWMFDADYPGHYMRRIKNVSLTIPCVTGPYIGIHCRLELLSSSTRVDGSLDLQTVKCGPKCSGNDCGYKPQHAEDPRFLHQYGGRESIATSSGQTDSGMFELNFRDERYLPFEFEGAVSRWCIELPPDNNQFDFDTLTDIIMHLSYTSREGSSELRKAANEVAQRHLPGGGWKIFDVRHEFPDAWKLFQRSQKPKSGHAHRDFSLRLNRNMFPFLTGRREVRVVSLHVFVEIPCTNVGEHFKAKFYKAGHVFDEDECCDDKSHEFECVVLRESPSLYQGILNVNLGPISGTHDFGTLRFPQDLGDIHQWYLLCQYEIDEKKCHQGREKIQHHRQTWGHVQLLGERSLS